MTGRKPMTKVSVAAALGVTALLTMTGSAFAGTADYSSTAGATRTQLVANSVGTIIAPANKKAQKTKPKK